MYVLDHILLKLIPMQNSFSIEAFKELNLKSKEWILSCSYNPHCRVKSEHLNIIRKDSDLLSTSYICIFLMGDYNGQPEIHYLKQFCDIYKTLTLI